MNGARPARERVVIAHLLPDLLNLYGDSGNVETLVRRATWRGIPAEVRPVGSHDAARLEGADIVVAGGGTDRNQLAVAEALDALAGPLRTAIGAGAALLAVCGGYQNLGHGYRSERVGEIRGPGLIDAWTEAPAGAERLVGGIVVDLDPGSPIRRLGRSGAALAGEPAGAETLVGFENHGGRTTLGPTVHPLGRVRAGRGNDGASGYEGAIALPGEAGIAGLRIGTYLHGPALPRNPHLADYVLLCGLARDALAEATELAPIPHDAGWRAHAAFQADWLAIRPGQHRTSRVGRVIDGIQSLVGF